MRFIHSSVNMRKQRKEREWKRYIERRAQEPRERLEEYLALNGNLYTSEITRDNHI